MAINADKRSRIRDAARLAPWPMVAALHDVSADDVRRVVESDVTDAEAVARAKRVRAFNPAE